MRRQILTLSLYKEFSHCKFPHKNLQQSEEFLKTTENVYDVTDTFLLFLNFTFCISTGITFRHFHTFTIYIYIYISFRSHDINCTIFFAFIFHNKLRKSNLISIRSIVFDLIKKKINKNRMHSISILWLWFRQTLNSSHWVLSLYGKIQDGEKLYPSIFYAVLKEVFVFVGYSRQTCSPDPRQRTSMLWWCCYYVWKRSWRSNPFQIIKPSDALYPLLWTCIKSSCESCIFQRDHSKEAFGIYREVIKLVKYSLQRHIKFKGYRNRKN